MKDPASPQYREIQEYLNSLSKSQQTEYNRIFWTVVNVESSMSVEYFADFVRTRDEHGEDSFSIRPFPSRAEKPYLWDVIDIVMDPAHTLVAVEKSRQLLITWAMCLVCLWTAKFRPNKLVFVQSKKEDDAANLVFNKDPLLSRISFMEYQLPPELRTVDFDRDASYGKLIFRHPLGASQIWGIPQGGDIIRSYTASLIFSDEYAFQPDAESAFTAARPTIDRGAKMVIVSSANGGAYMQRLIE
jgi:hypothetical protein